MASGARTFGLHETFTEPQVLPPPPVRHALLAFPHRARGHPALRHRGLERHPQWRRRLYAASAREMLAAGRRLLPRSAGAPLPDEPPLLHWLLLGSYKMLRRSSAVAARLPVALALVACRRADLPDRRTARRILARLRRRPDPSLLARRLYLGAFCHARAALRGMSSAGRSFARSLVTSGSKRVGFGSPVCGFAQRAACLTSGAYRARSARGRFSVCRRFAFAKRGCGFACCFHPWAIAAFVAVVLPWLLFAASPACGSAAEECVALAFRRRGTGARKCSGPIIAFVARQPFPLVVSRRRARASWCAVWPGAKSSGRTNSSLPMRCRFAGWRPVFCPFLLAFGTPGMHSMSDVERVCTLRRRSAWERMPRTPATRRDRLW